VPAAVAIATPASYVQHPLRFRARLRADLRVVRQCAQFDTRIVFPSTSEVYGMCADAEFDEEASPLVYGPVDKSRWIYACAKQLLDRVITALGKRRVCGTRSSDRSTGSDLASIRSTPRRRAARG